jgi:septal ring factor EnvC (AmiA/AmiB activator)
MNFQDSAAQKAAALIAELTANWSARSRRELQTFQKALEAAAKAAETALTTASIPPEGDKSIAKLVEQLSADANAHAEATARRVQADAQARIDELRKDVEERAKNQAHLSASLGELQTQSDGLRHELHAEKSQVATVRDDLERAREALAVAEAARETAEAASQEAFRQRSDSNRQLQELKSAVDATRAESVSVTRHLEIEAAERAKLAVALSTAQAQLQTAEAQHRTLTEQLNAANGQLRTLERAGADHERARGELQAKTNELQAKADEIARAEAALRQQTAQVERAMEQARATADAADEAARQANSEREQLATRTKTIQDEAAEAATLPLDRLLAALKQLAAGKTLADVLAALVEGIAQEFARVALFQVNNGQLEGVRQIGFDFKSDISKVIVPLNIDSMFSRAVKSGRVQGFAGSELTDSNRALFGGSPSFVMMLPIVICRDIIAVIYADDSGEKSTQFATPERKVKFVHLLLWYVTPMLPRFMMPREMDDLRQHAALLVNELEGMYTADRKAGQSDDAVRSRLRESLGYARQKYAQRVEGRDPAAAALLEEQLATVIKNKGGTTFGRDLAAIVGRGNKTPARPSLRTTAEA